jgi:predicted signal transduction protein with EAL and GGDEF domain
MQSLRRFALTLPETEEGVACAGTALEAVTVKRKGKAFLFLRATEARLKLDASLPEAEALATKNPARCQVGAHGWVLVKLDGKSDPLDVLKRWTAESHALLGGSKSTTKRSKNSERR